MVRSPKLSSLRLDRESENDLRWYFSYADGSMGLRSNFGGMVSKLEVGTSVSRTAAHEISDHVLLAAGKARKISRLLEKLGHEVRQTLLVTYGLGQDPQLHAFRHLAGLVPHLSVTRNEFLSVTPRTSEEFERRIFDRPLIGWLSELARRAKSSTPVDLEARRIMTAIVTEGEKQLVAACRAYSHMER